MDRRGFGGAEYDRWYKLTIRCATSLSKDSEVNLEEIISEWELLENGLQLAQIEKGKTQGGWEWCNEYLARSESIAMFVNGMQVNHLFLEFDGMVWDSNPEGCGTREQVYLREPTPLLTWCLTEMDASELCQRKRAGTHVRGQQAVDKCEGSLGSQVERVALRVE